MTAVELAHVDKIEQFLATATADDGHAILRDTLALVESIPLRIAVAVHVAHETRAWKHDEGTSEAHYTAVMNREGFRSMLPAYCAEEFGLRENMTWYSAQVGELICRVGKCPQIVDTRPWSRVTAGALRPLAQRGVLIQHDDDELAAVLEFAAGLADERKPEDCKTSPKITEKDIRAAMEKCGVFNPSATGSAEQLDPAEKRAAQRVATTTRAERDLRWLAQHGYADTLRDLVLLSIKMLGDRPDVLDKIRQKVS